MAELLVHENNWTVSPFTRAILKHLGDRAELFWPNTKHIPNAYCTAEQQAKGWELDRERYTGKKLLLQVAGQTPTFVRVDNPKAVNVPANVLRNCAPALALGLPRVLIARGEEYPPLQDSWPNAEPIAILDKHDATGSWEDWPQLKNTGVVDVAIVHDFVKDADEYKWASMIKEGMEVYGKGWEDFCGYNKTQFMGPVSWREGCEILSRAKCTLYVDSYCSERYRAVAAGCLPVFYKPIMNLNMDPYHIRSCFRLCKFAPNWRALDELLQSKL